MPLRPLIAVAIMLLTTGLDQPAGAGAGRDASTTRTFT